MYEKSNKPIDKYEFMNYYIGISLKFRTYNYVKFFIFHYTAISLKLQIVEESCSFWIGLSGRRNNEVTAASTSVAFTVLQGVAPPVSKKAG